MGELEQSGAAGREPPRGSIGPVAPADDALWWRARLARERVAELAELKRAILARNDLIEDGLRILARRLASVGEELSPPPGAGSAGPPGPGGRHPTLADSERHRLSLAVEPPRSSHNGFHREI